MSEPTPIQPAAPVDRSIPFVDVAAQRRRLGDRLDRAILRVLDHGQYIMGPEVGVLEKQLAAFAGTDHALSCASGTDALVLALMAWGIGPGDAVFVPAFTFCATAEAAALLGASPVFCDVTPDTFTLDPDSLAAAVPVAKAAGLTPRAVIPVDLFGQPADYRRLTPAAAEHGLKILADAAQGFGATLDGRPVGGFCDAVATSFFPAKPLGCCGDGGAVFTDDPEMAATLVSLRMHGKGGHRYEHVRIGVNGRLDTVQAAVLIEKLAIFPDEIVARRRIAARYAAGLAGAVAVPTVMAGAASVWAQYTILIEQSQGGRDAAAERLKAVGVPTAVHYPIPLNAQPAYRRYPVAPGGTPTADSLAGRVLSLPMHPYLDEETQDRIIAAVRAAV
jgi:dTDP-4-amino-4,6-dideoxygalactose transaminase